MPFCDPIRPSNNYHDVLLIFVIFTNFYGFSHYCIDTGEQNI